MFKKFIAGIALFFFLSITLLAQQEPLFSQYMFSKLYYNPGYAGTNNAICAMGLYRQQWVGFKDMEGNMVAPLTYTVNIDAPVRVLKGGVGVSITSDKLGFQESINVRLGYSYHLETASGTLGIGLMVGFLDNRIDFSKFKPIEDDPLLSQLGAESEMLIDASLGLFYKVPDQYYIGLSASQLLQTKSLPLSESESAALRMQLRRHYYFMGGYTIGLPRSPAFEIEPSIFFRTDGTSFSADVTALIRYNNRFWGGLSYRYQDAVVAILGMKYKNIYIGYSYDITISAMGGTRSSGSHELMAGYCFKLEIEKLKQSYKNTRFL